MEVGLAPARRFLRRRLRLAEVLRLAELREAVARSRRRGPETFSTGVAIAVEIARTAVSALSAIETALSVTVSDLVELVVDPVDGAARS